MSAIKAASDKKIIVVKVGTESIALPNGNLDEEFLRPFTQQLAVLRKKGHCVVLVSSGAVNLGRRMLLDAGYNHDDLSSMSYKATAASLGQPVMMTKYQSLFREAGIHICGQFMVRNKDFTEAHRAELNNLHRSLGEFYSRPGSIAIFNENDTISYDENQPVLASDATSFSDNDGSASLLAQSLHADKLIFVSTHAVHNCNPALRESNVIRDINFGQDDKTPEALQISTEGASNAGRGGMGIKIEKACDFLRAGRSCGRREAWILSRGEVAFEEGVLAAVYDRSVGTKLACSNQAVDRKGTSDVCAGRGKCQPWEAFNTPRLTFA